MNKPVPPRPAKSGLAEYKNIVAKLTNQALQVERRKIIKSLPKTNLKRKKIEIIDAEIIKRYTNAIRNLTLSKLRSELQKIRTSPNTKLNQKREKIIEIKIRAIRKMRQKKPAPPRPVEKIKLAKPPRPTTPAPSRPKYRRTLSRIQKRKLLLRLKQNWQQLKNIWNTALTEQERKFLLTHLSENQKRELEENRNMEIVNNIKEKIYSENKNISPTEWEQAKEASASLKGRRFFEYNTRKLLEKPRRTIINTTKLIDIFETKLKSQEKNISERFWEKAKKATNEIPKYKEYITTILQSKQEDVIQAAKKIDAAEQILTEKDLNMITAKKVLITLDILPEYKEYIRKIIYRFFPHLEQLTEMQQREEQRKQLKIMKQRLKASRKRRGRAQAAVKLLDFEEEEE